MKKMMKKLIAMAAALVMIVTLLPAVGAKAELLPPTIDGSKKGTVTIKKDYGKNGEVAGQVGGVTFSLYKIASFTPEKDGTYSKWELEDIYANIGGLDPDTLGNVDTTALENKVKDIQDIITKNEIKAAYTGTTAEKTENGKIFGYVTISDIDLGYYLVVETGVPSGYVASKPFFISVPRINKESGSHWEYEFTVEPKNEKVPPIDKTANTDTAGVGDDVTYTLTGPSVPIYDDSYDKSTLKYIITDTMSEGLTFEKETSDITVESVEADGMRSTLEETRDYAYNFSNQTLTISLTGEKVTAQAGKQIVVTYKAKINEKAVVGSVGNDNTVVLEYTNKPGSSITSQDNKKVYSFKIQVNKKNQSDEPLAGAIFDLYRDEACTDCVVQGISDPDGIIDFGTIKAGTYYLKELAAPDGYTLLTSPIKVEIYDANKEADTYEFEYKVNNEATGTDIESNGIVSIDVVNHKGFTLPSTGGMGTYLFTIGGIVIMAGAAFALIAMKKRA